MPKIYVGSNGIARKSKRIYVGVNGTARRCKKIYVGDSNGRARLAFCDIPTNIDLHGGKNKNGYFTYENQNYAKNYSANLTNFIVDIKNPTETVRVYYDSLSGINYYDQEITAGRYNELFACPEYAKWWFGQSVVPSAFVYNTYDVYASSYDDTFTLRQLEIRYPSSCYITFTAPKSGYLYIHVKEFDVDWNPSNNNYYLVLGPDYGNVANLSDGLSNRVYQRYVSRGQTCYIGVNAHIYDSGVPGGFWLYLDAIWIE